MDLDEERVARVSAATIQALSEVEAQVQRLSTMEATGASPDRRVMVRVTGAGQVTQLWLRDGALRSYDTAALSELLTRTIGDAQRRARAANDAAVATLVPDELAHNEEELRRVWRD
jgi:DNA-binding protein YbaB